LRALDLGIDTPSSFPLAESLQGYHHPVVVTDEQGALAFMTRCGATGARIAGRCGRRRLGPSVRRSLDLSSSSSTSTRRSSPRRGSKRLHQLSKGWADSASRCSRPSAARCSASRSAARSSGRSRAVRWPAVDWMRGLAEQQPW